MNKNTANVIIVVSTLVALIVLILGVKFFNSLGSEDSVQVSEEYPAAEVKEFAVVSLGFDPSVKLEHYEGISATVCGLAAEGQGSFVSGLAFIGLDVGVESSVMVGVGMFAVADRCPEFLPTVLEVQ